MYKQKLTTLYFKCLNCVNKCLTPLMLFFVKPEVQLVFPKLYHFKYFVPVQTVLYHFNVNDLSVTRSIAVLPIYYLRSSERKDWKIQAWTGLEPSPLQYQCSALPIELSGQLETGHFLWLNDKPVDSGYMQSNLWSFIWTVHGNNVNGDH